MTFASRNVVRKLSVSSRSMLLSVALLIALSVVNVNGFRKISFGNSRTQQRCAARGEYCTTNDQCCGYDSGSVGCMTLSGIGQCLSERDREIVFETPCETTEDCSEGYCCVIPSSYRRTRQRRCKPKRGDYARCPDEALEDSYYNYVRVGKGKRRMESAYGRHGYY